MTENEKKSKTKKKKLFISAITFLLSFSIIIYIYIPLRLLQDNYNKSVKQLNSISAGSYHTVALKSDSTVVAVGDNEDNQCSISD
jgi:alpha-tubulin suppressor-like RCC1 family protein